MAYQLLIREKNKVKPVFFQHPLLPKLGREHGDLS